MVLKKDVVYIYNIKENLDGFGFTIRAKNSSGLDMVFDAKDEEEARKYPINKYITLTLSCED